MLCSKPLSYGVTRHPEPNAHSRRSQVEFLNHKVTIRHPLNHVWCTITGMEEGWAVVLEGRPETSSSASSQHYWAQVVQSSMRWY